MKIISILFLTFLPFNVLAETTSLFPGSDAVILIQGTNDDAKRLYDSMNVEAVKNESLLEKKIEIDNADPSQTDTEIVYTLTCNYSELSNSTSCTFKIYNGFFYPGISHVEKDNKYALFKTTSKFQAQRFAKLFTNPDSQGWVYLSEDKNFQIHIQTIQSSGSDTINRFMISYSGE